MTGRSILALAAIAIVIVSGGYALGRWLAAGGVELDAATSAPSLRVRRALDEPDAILRTAVLANVLQDLSREQLEEVVAVYEERMALVPPSRSAIELLGEAWASLDPEGAIERISGWPEEPRRIALASITRAWAMRSPNAAFAWASSLLFSDRTDAIDAVFEGWAATDDPEVWDFLATLTPGLDRETSTSTVVKTIVQNHGFDELFTRIDAIENDHVAGSPRDFKLAALRSAVGHCAYHDPDKALAYARRYAGGPYDNGLLRRLAVYWAVHDGPRAMDALLALPSEPQRDRALRDGYMKWIRSERQRALAWMPADAADDERYRPLIDLYTMALAQNRAEDPLEPIRQALDWVDRIDDPKQRRDASILIGRLWFRLQPEDAAAWIDGRGIREEVELAIRLHDEHRQRARQGGGPTRRGRRPAAAGTD